MDDEAQKLIREAESLGIRLGCESGYTTAKMPATGDAEKLEGIARLLSKHLKAVTRAAAQRAGAARASEFAGQVAFLPDMDTLVTIDGFVGDVATVLYTMPAAEEEERKSKVRSNVEAQCLLFAAPEID